MAVSRELKPLFDSALLHDLIGCKAGFDFAVYRYVCVCDRAVPDIMVAFPMPDKIAAVFLEFFPNDLLIFSHKRAPHLPVP